MRRSASLACVLVVGRAVTRHAVEMHLPIGVDGRDDVLAVALVERDLETAVRPRYRHDGRTRGRRCEGSTGSGTKRPVCGSMYTRMPLCAGARPVSSPLAVGTTHAPNTTSPTATARHTAIPTSPDQAAEREPECRTATRRAAGQ